nr:MAG TPA: hypothetical protein [Caudoviricetes sp.]
MTNLTPIKITLLKAHTHAGQIYEVNDTLTVSQTTADWLITHGIAEPLKSEKSDDKADTAKKLKTTDKEQE